MPRKRAINPERISRANRVELDGGIIKSARRVIEIFELFSDLRTGATVADIADMLNTPKSSMSALLRSLHTLGYLGFDAQDRTYRPIGRLAVLDYWADPGLVGEGPAISIARQVAGQSGYSAYLVIRNKLTIQLLFRSYGSGPNARTRSPNGSGSFITQSVTGLVLLSSLDRRDVVKIVTAVNARLPNGDCPVGMTETLAAIDEVRRTGYLAGRSQLTDARTTLAFRLPAPLSSYVALGISVPSDVLAERGAPTYARMVQDAIDAWLPGAEPGLRSDGAP